jgi:hypothetical protein
MLEHVELDIAARRASIASQLGKRPQSGQQGRKRHVPPAVAAWAKQEIVDAVGSSFSAIHALRLREGALEVFDLGHKPSEKACP